MLTEDNNRALISLANEDDLSNWTYSESRRNSGVVKTDNSGPSPSTLPKTTPKRDLDGGRAGKGGETDIQVSVRPSASPVGPSPPETAEPTGDYGLDLDAGNLVAIGAGSEHSNEKTEDDGEKSSKGKEDEEEKKKQLELEKGKFRRKRDHGPPRLTFFGTLASTFITLLLLAVTTLLVGVPPLYMSSLSTRKVYVGLMIPILTVVITVLHYYVTEYPMRQVNLFMLKLGQDVEKQNSTLGTSIADLNTLEDVVYQQQMETQQSSLTDKATTPLLEGTTRSTRSLSASPGRQATSPATFPLGSLAPHASSHSVCARTSPRDGVLQAGAKTDSDTSLPDPLKVSASVAAHVTRQKRWMENKISKLNELHENAIHPEVHSQQRLLRYFLTTFFQFQTVVLTAWAERVVRTLSQHTANDAASGWAQALHSIKGPGNTAFASSQTSACTTPVPSGLTPLQRAPGPHDTFVPQRLSLRTAFASPLSISSPFTTPTGVRAASVQEAPVAASPNGNGAVAALTGKRPNLQVRVVEQDDLTFNTPSNLRSPDSSASRPTPQGMKGAVNASTVGLPRFSPIMPELKPNEPPPKRDVTDILNTARPQQQGPPTASTESQPSTPSVPGATPAALAREMRNHIRPTTKMMVADEEADETIKVDVTDPSSAVQTSRGRDSRVSATRSSPERQSVHAENPRTPPPQPTMPLPVSAQAATITVKRCHRFVGDAPWVFFFLRVREEIVRHPRTFSTSTNVTQPGSPLNRSRNAASVSAHEMKTIAFEAHVSLKGNADDTELPPFFSRDTSTHRPYAPFYVDEIRQKRGALSVIEQLRLDFGYCEVEQDTELMNGSGSDREVKVGGDGSFDGRFSSKRRADSEVRDSASTDSPILRQQTHAMTSHSNKNTSMGSRREPGTLASSYVLSWKPFAERPMRLTFLSVYLDDAEDGAEADNTDKKPVWLPVLECLIDDVLCVLTDAMVTVDRSSQEVIGIELRGISIEDMSRTTSQLLSSSTASTNTLPAPRRQNGFTGSPPHEKNSRLTLNDTSTHRPGVHGGGHLLPPVRVGSGGVKTIGQVITEIVVMSNVPSGDDN